MVVTKSFIINKEYNMKYKYMLAALVLGCTLMTGCEKEEVFDLPEGAILLNTEGFQNDDKTSVSGTTVQWVGGESVIINNNDYTVTVDDGHAYVSGSAIDVGTHVYGFYGCGTVSGSGTSYSVTVPSSYSCSYSGGRQVIALPMVAYDDGASTATNSLTFKHVTAAVKVTVKNKVGSDIVLDNVSVSSPSYKLSGTTPLTLSDAGEPTVATAEGSGMVIVNFTDSPEIEADDTLAVQVPIRPIGSSDLTINIAAHQGSQTYFYTQTIPASSISSGLARNVMLSANTGVLDDDSYTYTANSTPLTFEAMANGATVKFLKNSSDASSVTLQYRKLDANGTPVSDYDWANNRSITSSTTGESITLTSGQKVQFRATSSPTHTSMATGAYSYNYFTLTGDCYVYGNVMSLLNNSFSGIVDLTSYGEYTFQSLFCGCSDHLYIHPTKELVLPATTLTSNCYNGMFSGCTSLTAAPTLSATTLAQSCYASMFQGCTSLTAAPALPATTLAQYCYYFMFYGCTSLQTAPALPATTLAESCYYYMFSGCTSLQTAPALPATTLAESCYYYMFGGCTSLQTAPDLTSTSLANNCYEQMFYGCSSLTTAPTLPATTLASSCYEQMFYGCSSLTTAPALPATTLASSCYEQMFRGCSNLTTAPTIAANTFSADGECEEMFRGCSNLASITWTGEFVLGGDAMMFAQQHLRDMLRNAGGSAASRTIICPNTTMQSRWNSLKYNIEGSSWNVSASN